jgi:hypothetical protein
MNQIKDKIWPIVWGLVKIALAVSLVFVVGHILGFSALIMVAIFIIIVGVINLN